MRKVNSALVELREALGGFVGVLQGAYAGRGAGKEPLVAFCVRDLEVLPPVLYWLDPCHSGLEGWRCEVQTCCARSTPAFVIIGPVGKKGYRGATWLAKVMRAAQRHALGDVHAHHSPVVARRRLAKLMREAQR